MRHCRRGRLKPFVSHTLIYISSGCTLFLFHTNVDIWPHTIAQSRTCKELGTIFQRMASWRRGQGRTRGECSRRA
jgi:hypothetical protein